MVELKIDLPEGFLELEERCGYLVSEKIRKVWAVELDLLSEFDRICRKHEIKYAVCGGTTLGAVRHKGFIPWDDDIDIMMFRTEYDKLCKIAGREFRDPYFWQTEYTDKGSLRGHAQLRNSRTTGILQSEFGRRSFNQGIFIDIFPCDNVIEDKIKLERQVRKIRFYKKLSAKIARATILFDKKKYRRNFPVLIVHYIAEFVCSIWDLETLFYHKMELECTRYNWLRNVTHVTAFGFSPDDPVHYKSKKGLDNPVLMDFEFLKVPVSSTWDEDLHWQYGDYMVYQQGGSYHGDVIWDADRSYMEYLKEGNIVGT